MELEDGQVGEMVRVRQLSTDGLRVFLELRNGKTGWIDLDEPVSWVVGTVLMIIDGGGIQELPTEMWPAESWVGVVRKRLEGEALISGASGVVVVPDAGAVPYVVGNTVEVQPGLGVTRVLSEEPVRYLDDPVNLDAAVERFRVAPESVTYTFDDFGGLVSIVARAQELIKVQLEKHDIIAAMGARPVKGILFTGPPGTGKTMLARIIASQAGAEFYQISGPEIFSKWYGESEELLRRIFDHARAKPRAIIFFDEIDSVAGRRDENAHEASKRVVAQLLTLMDGFKAAENVVVIAATNRPQDIDVALRRPGRFDWEIAFPLPSEAERLQVLQATERRHLVLRPLPLHWIAGASEGWSPADLAAIFSEAAILAASDTRTRIGIEDVLVGFTRVAAQRQLVAAEWDEDS